MMIGIMMGVIVTIATMVWLSGWYIICHAIFSNTLNPENEGTQINLEDKHFSRGDVEDMVNLEHSSFDNWDEDYDFAA